MNITVILCTYNRCESLRKALASVAVSVVPEGVAWEVLVIDNNSSDQTRMVIDGFRRQDPGRFRYVFEPRPGKSYALNSAISGARGDVLAFMDDDVTVEATWLRNLTEPLNDSSLAGTGGRILPQPGFNPPRWLPLDGPDNMGGILALFDMGDVPGPLTKPPFGTNMAYRHKIFEKYGNFRTDMGPRPGSEIRNEDTELGRRILSAGERLWYVPSAIVYHAVPENRLTKEYFERFWFDQGRASVRERKHRPAILGIPRDYFTALKMVVVLAENAICWILTLNPRQRFYRKFWVWMTAGKVVEFYRQAFYGTTRADLRP